MHIIACSVQAHWRIWPAIFPLLFLKPPPCPLPLCPPLTLPTTRHTHAPLCLPTTSLDTPTHHIKQPGCCGVVCLGVLAAVHQLLDQAHVALIKRRQLLGECCVIVVVCVCVCLNDKQRVEQCVWAGWGSGRPWDTRKSQSWCELHAWRGKLARLGRAGTTAVA